MRSTKAVRIAKTGCIIASALLMALGVLMIAWPGLSISLVGIVAGAMLIALGILKLMGYFSRDMYQLAFQYDLAFGLLLMALGVLLLMQPNRAMHFLCLIVGISIAADGLLKFQTALEARRFGLSTWWLIMALGILAGIIGIVTAFRPAQSSQVLMILMGVSLLAEGALNLCVTLCAVKIVRHRKPDVIEAEFEEKN